MIKDLQVEVIALNNPEQFKIAIIQSTYHAELNNNLTEYCKAVLLQNNILEKNIKVYYAAGSWEIPLIAEKLAKTNEFDALVTFSVLVKGDTYHFDMIANEVARSLMNTMVQYEIPIAFEILAVNTLHQAISRASDDNYNKGIEAGNAVLKTLQTLQTLAV